MQQRKGAAGSARITVRLSREDQHKVEEAAKARGHASPSAFVRAAIRNELNGRREQTGTEERIAGGFDRVSKDISRVGRSQQALFALVDTFAAHGVVMSDERLPIEVLDPAQMTSVEGRVLVHGQDEQTGRNYLMLEGTDAKIHFIHYTPEMEEARSRGELRTNSFVRLRKVPVDRALMLDVTDLGDAEMLLNNPSHLGETARQLLKRGIMPTEDGWGGWLGRYQSALCKTTREIEERNERDWVRKQERRRDRSRGR